MSDKALKDGDYRLIDGSGWFALKGFAIRINGTDEGVVVDVYKDGAEMDAPVASTYAFDSELIDDDEEEA